MRNEALALLTAAALLGGCKNLFDRPAPAGGMNERDFADGLQTVLAADREVYTKQVVNRLQNEEKVLKAGEH